jgi:hypothetical protein
MYQMKAIVRLLTLAAALMLGSLPAWGDDLSFSALQPGPSTATVSQAGAGPARLPYSDSQPWPPPGGQTPPDLRPYDLGRPGGIAPADRPTLPPVAPSPAPPDRPVESTWYYRLESFYWNERSGGVDFVNEAGPISALGYLHRYGQERVRFELFGGTVSYDGAAEFRDGTSEAYHQAFGTNYLGLRGEYDLLIEPAAWSKARLVLGVGTRFWIRDLRDAVTPSGAPVDGYQETWWTFYPYVGLETKESDESGPKLFGSARFGVTPLTFQRATFFDTNVYPKCGVTGQARLGMTYRRFTADAYLEAMTWGASADVRGTFQPASRMLTVGGELGYSF